MKIPKQKERRYYVQPGPAENIKVCTICKFEPETCGHDTEVKDRSSLRTGVVWCCDWQSKEYPHE